MSKTKVVLVDDHKLFRDGLLSLLQNSDKVEVVSAYASSEDLLHNLKGLHTDIVITDISMSRMNGIELTEHLHQNFPCIKVMILSMHNNEEFIMKALEAGAKAYLPKDIAGTELIEAITSVAQGEEYYNPMISATIMKSLTRKKQEERENHTLTSREIEVLKLVADGLMNKEVADKLNISIRTVDCHKNNILNKLELNTTAELVKYAIRNQLIEI